MEIVETIKHTEEYWFAILFFSGISMLVIYTSLIIISSYKKEGVDTGDIVIGILLTGVGVMFGVWAYQIHDVGVAVSYKAKITDINEVEEQGYIITDQEDEIYTLQKKNDN